MKKKVSRIRLKSAVNIFLALVIALGASGALAAGGFPLLQTRAAVQDADIEALKSAMDSFESYMKTVYSAAASDRTKIPDATWLKNAYAAYADAQKAYDLYYLGGASDNISAVSSLTSALSSYLTSITYWTPYTGEATASEDGTLKKANLVTNLSVNGTTATDLMQNVIGVYGVGSAAPYTHYKEGNSGGWDGGYCDVKIIFGNIVLLYDGVTAPAVPINLSEWANGNYQQYINAMYQSTTKEGDFSLTNTYWHSGLDSAGQTSEYQTAGGEWISKERNLSGSDHSEDGQLSSWGSGNGDQQYYSNTLKYQGTPSGYVAQYSVSTVDSGYDAMTFHYHICRATYNYTKAHYVDLVANATSKTADYSSYSSIPTDTMELIANGDCKTQRIWVVNYKLVVDAIQAAALENLSKYSEGGYSAFVDAYTAAEALNPNDSFEDGSVSGSKVVSSGVSTAIDNLTSAMQSAENGLSSPGLTENKCDALREAIEECMETYNTQNADGQYCTPLWDAFADAYKAAQKVICDEANNNYPTSDEIATAAEALTAAYNALDGHNLKEVAGTDGTCFTGGVKTHYECQNEGCGLWFSDAEGKQLVTEDDLTEACNGHLGLVEQPYLAPTADSVGYKHHWYCTVCGCHYWTQEEAKADTVGDTSLSHIQTVLFLLTVVISPADGTTLDTDFLVNLQKIENGSNTTTSGLARVGEDGKATVSFIVEQGSCFVSIDSGWLNNYTVTNGYNTGINALVTPGTNGNTYGSETNPAAVELTVKKTNSDDGTNARTGTDSAVNNFTVVAESE